MMDRDTMRAFERSASLFTFILGVLIVTDLLLASVVAWGLDAWVHGTSMCWPGVLASWLISCFVVAVAHFVRKRRTDDR